MAVVHTKVVEHLTEKDGSRRVDIQYTTDQGDILRRDNILLPSYTDAVDFALQMQNSVETKLAEEEYAKGKALVASGVHPSTLVFRYNTKAAALQRMLEESQASVSGAQDKLTLWQTITTKVSLALGS